MNKLIFTTPFLSGLLMISVILLGTQAKSKSIPDLPEAVTSFGACKIGNFVYVYGGHVGEAHVYSKETHSKSFVRLDLKKVKNWESLPFDQPLQGFGMAAHNGRIYISGGSQATNEDGEESNLSSLSSVSFYDINAKKWRKSTPLPEPRSSHEMVAHNGKLYVVGGWHMKDGRGVNWHNHGLVAEISEKPLKWRKLPETEWSIRANSAAVVEDYLYVVGGLNDEGTSNAVHRLGLKSMNWEEVSEFPGTNRIKAFGSASTEIGGKLLVSPFSYQPRLFNESNSTWVITTAKVKEKRFFHRLIPLNRTKVLFIGGASWDGHLNGIEVLNFDTEIKGTDSLKKNGRNEFKTNQWRGFRGDGNSLTKETLLPLNWSDDKNIAWRKELKGYGQSTPVVWGSNVYSTSTLGDESEQLIIHCHDLSSGLLKWEKTMKSPVRIKRSQYVSQAAPSPVTDAKGVYVFFESGFLMALDHSGNEIWQRSLTNDYGPMMGNHGIGSSLFQSGKSLGVLVDHGGPSYLLNLEKATGRIQWKVDRPERVSWSTPTLRVTQDREILYISSNGVVECIDFKSGKMLWQKDGVEGNTVASPTLSKDLVIVGSSKPSQTMAFSSPASPENGGEISWVAEDATCSFGSPLATEKFVYLVNRAGVASCHGLSDGKKLWNVRLPGSCWASPLHSPGRVYFFTKDGVTVVLKDDGSSLKIAENSLTIEGRVYGFAAAGNSLVLRTGSELICIRQRDIK